MSIKHIRLGERGYALIHKGILANVGFIRGDDHFDNEVAVVPAIVTSIHMHDLVTVSIGEPEFKIPANNVFYDRAEANNAAKKQNAHFENMEEREFKINVYVTGMVTVAVKAKNACMAERKAEKLVEGMNFGELKNVSWECEDEDKEVDHCYYR